MFFRCEKGLAGYNDLNTKSLNTEVSDKTPIVHEPETCQLMNNARYRHDADFS